MLARYIALGDGDETGEAGLGGKHIVIAGIEAPLRHTVSEREQMALRVIEKAEIHCMEKSVYLCCHVFKSPGKRPGLPPATPQR